MTVSVNHFTTHFYGSSKTRLNAETKEYIFISHKKEKSANLKGSQAFFYVLLQAPRSLFFLSIRAGILGYL